MFSLVVTDPLNASSAPDTVTITVNPPANQGPTANAGPDQTVASGASVALTGAGSTDPEGGTLSYAWTQTSGPAVTLTGATTVSPGFTAPTLAAGDPPAVLVFSLVVTDPLNASSAPDTVTITVNPPANLIATHGPAASKAVATFARARELCERLGEPPEYLQVMFWLATASVVRGRAAAGARSHRRIAERRRSARQSAGIAQRNTRAGDDPHVHGTHRRRPRHARTRS